MGDDGGEEKPKKATFLKKAERAACWEAKDNLWACWDKGKQFNIILQLDISQFSFFS